MIPALTNHLWQSTLFVAAAAVVTVALRRNGAHVRHAIWVVASLKFLVPFSLLISLGSLLPLATPDPTGAAPDASTPAPRLAVAVERLAQPFSSDIFDAPVATPNASAPTTPRMTIAIAAVWAIGSVVVGLMRLQGWRRVWAAVRASVPLPLASPIPARSSSFLLEPGVIGIWRPVLLLPAGIEQHLSLRQLEAVLTHELCHVRRRDNLTSAFHMVVEAAFWFHPLVWFIGARLVDERERACDEHVLRVCGEPRTYAESILNVCKLYAESPLACVSGVSGSDLKKRVVAIMGNRIGQQLNVARRVALTMAAVLAIALPLVAGMVTAPLRAAGFAGAQTAGASAGQASATFDVVSIKPCPAITPTSGVVPVPAGARGGVAWWSAQTTPGHVYWHCATLAQLINQAYADRNHPLLNTTTQLRIQESFQPKHVRGGPSWVGTDKFTIEATASIGVTNPGLSGSAGQNLSTLPETMSRALRAVLEERFQLKVRRATEERDMYALKLGKNGLNRARMKEAKPGDCVSADAYFATDPTLREDLRICGRYFSAKTGLEYADFSLAELARSLSTMMELFVRDETGVNAKFTFVLQYPADAATPDERLASALEAVGLKVDRTKGPAEYFVIESVQKPRPNLPSDAVGPPARAQGVGPRR